MDADNNQSELDEKLKQRFHELPKVVQDSITSADVQKHLRELADTNKLHLDQWQLLENEVMLTLLGFQAPEELASNLKADLDIPESLAKTLAEDISKIVFEPVRKELEEGLEAAGPKDAVSAAQSTVASPVSPVPASPATIPATPPTPAPIEKAVRAPISESYKAGEASTARKAVSDDPYRETPA